MSRIKLNCYFCKEKTKYSSFVCTLLENLRQFQGLLLYVSFRTVSSSNTYISKKLFAISALKAYKKNSWISDRVIILSLKKENVNCNSHTPWTSQSIISELILTRRAQSFTSLMADLHQGMYGGFAFSRCLKEIFPWRRCSVKALVS